MLTYRVVQEIKSMANDIKKSYVRLLSTPLEIKFDFESNLTAKEALRVSIQVCHKRRF